MNPCEVCGNVYEEAFVVKLKGESLWFDSFECAIHRLAPKCSHCGVTVIGHGIQLNDRIFCCAHCTRSEGHQGAVDHI